MSIRAQISSRPPRPEQQRHERKHSHKPDTASGGRRCVECAGGLEILPLASTVFAPSCEAGAVVQRRDHDTPICSRAPGRAGLPWRSVLAARPSTAGAQRRRYRAGPPGSDCGSRVGKGTLAPACRVCGNREITLRCCLSLDRCQWLTFSRAIGHSRLRRGA